MPAFLISLWTALTGKVSAVIALIGLAAAVLAYMVLWHDSSRTIADLTGRLKTETAAYDRVNRANGALDGAITFSNDSLEALKRQDDAALATSQAALKTAQAVNKTRQAQVEAILAAPVVMGPKACTAAASRILDFSR